jgi:hypothetical protein
MHTQGWNNRYRNTLQCTILQPSNMSEDIARHGHDVLPWVGHADSDVVHQIWAHLGIHMAPYPHNDAPVKIDKFV